MNHEPRCRNDITVPLHECHGVSNHWQLDYYSCSFFRQSPKKKIFAWLALDERNLTLTLQRAIHVESVSMSWRNHGPLIRYQKLWVAHAPGMPGTFCPPSRVSDPDMHHGTCMTHVPWCVPGSLTSCFLWSRWRWKRFRHSRRMHNPQFYVSGKRPMEHLILERYDISRYLAGNFRSCIVGSAQTYLKLSSLKKGMFNFVISIVVVDGVVPLSAQAFWIKIITSGSDMLYVRVNKHLKCQIKLLPNLPNPCMEIKSSLWVSAPTLRPCVIDRCQQVTNPFVLSSLQWRHNDHDGVSNRQPHGCLLNRLFRRRSKKHQSSASLAFVRGIHRYRWSPRTNGQ